MFNLNFRLQPAYRVGGKYPAVEAFVHSSAHPHGQAHHVVYLLRRCAAPNQILITNYPHHSHRCVGGLHPVMEDDKNNSSGRGRGRTGIRQHVATALPITAVSHDMTDNTY